MSKCAIIFGIILIPCIIFELVSCVNFEVYSGGMIAKGNVPGFPDDDFDIYVPGSPKESSSYFLGAVLADGYTSKVGWITYSKFINTSNSTFNEMKLLYNDIDGLNVGIMFNNSQQTSVGNLITCNDCGIDDYDKIGGDRYQCGGSCKYANILPRYFPIYMNSIWDLDDITSIANGPNENFISITAYFYNVYVDIEDSDWYNGIRNRLFMNASGFALFPSYDSFLSPNNSLWGYVSARYKDVNKIFDDLGDPSDWASLYDEYYWQQSETSWIFIYGFYVECSNYDMYEKLMMGPPSTTMQPTNASDTDNGSLRNINAWMILCCTSFLFL